MFTRNLTILIMLCAIGCGQSDSRFRLKLIDTPPSSVEQFDLFEFDFEIAGVVGNPYDAGNIDVRLEITTADGRVLTQPAFFTEDHAIIEQYGREIVRDQGTAHWSVRWTPMEPGSYTWQLIASHAGKDVSQNGQLDCVPSNRAGFVRVSQVDARFFETSDGNFFYPIGHVTRSPDDDRWNPLAFDSSVIDAVPAPKPSSDTSQLRVGKYQRWFERMHEAGENSCVIWMSPWWLGLEWSPTRPGYSGLGKYNQRHAAQLDRILQLAEQYQIRVLLYTANHGRYSTVIDPQWFENPYLKTASGGLVDSPTAYFESSDCAELEKNRLRYILARWGYSTALMGLGLCTEVGWVDPYHGFQSEPSATRIDGVTRDRQPIPRDQELVVSWFRSMADFVRASDVHGHMVTIQFAKLEDGNEAWEQPEFDIVLNNAYRGQLTSGLVNDSNSTVPQGVVDGFLAWERTIGHNLKPRLVAEWGGHHQHNVRSCLETELRLGIWALSMSELSGITGFWWADAIDQSNLYHLFGAVHRFWGTYDRRGKELRSQLVDVSLLSSNPLKTDNSSEVFIKHPTRGAVALANSTEGFIYVYHHDANTCDVPASNELLFPVEEDAWIALPDSLPGGVFDVEFWDAGTGQMLSQALAVHARERHIPLPRFRVDLAIKLRCSATTAAGPH